MLFNNLMALSENNDAFYYSDQEITISTTTYTVRSFNYRIAPYSLFELPAALDSRGTAFYSVKDSDDWTLFTRAFRKFFNLGEGVPAEIYTAKPPIVSYEKLDGSIILVGSIEGNLICKSKSSINSDHAQLAQSILNTSLDLKRFCEFYLTLGYTPVFELVGPSFPIVLRYPEDTLVLLGVVNNITGNFCTSVTAPHLVKQANEYYLSWDNLLDIQETSLPDIEGFVVTTSDGTMVKVKVKSYVALHALKDSVNNPKVLTELILTDKLDDLFSAYSDHPETLKYITEEQLRISKIYNTLVEQVETFYTHNKHLDRKSYAIKAQEQPGLLGLLMSKYLNKSMSYISFFMKNKLYEQE